MYTSLTLRMHSQSLNGRRVLTKGATYQNNNNVDSGACAECASNKLFHTTDNNKDNWNTITVVRTVRKKCNRLINTYYGKNYTMQSIQLQFLIGHKNKTEEDSVAYYIFEAWLRCHPYG